jgi:hypothetical protein
MAYQYRREMCEAPPVREHNIATPFRDAHERESLRDRCVVARCPRCRTPLVARVTCTGPHFTCLCEEHRFG